ncbi:MAG: DUF4167 domain-containing protein [Alphaproteobacteria bacterium]|nr:DUF4167 domain-containing protein [Alphaproteobacteria bacterium]NCQ87855.1 DUF4167 domain-containing protein [Alphaproteobacteria bacterium]NCT05637.1 DUF4167 domain-containing protein [Alphaproteobacteria bacterium]
MKHNSTNRRSRGRGGNRRPNGGNNRMQVFDSNGPDIRIRGTAHQICEKYVTLAKDARATGDYVTAESYLQHAEHYQRIISSWNEQNDQFKPVQNAQYDDDFDDDLSLPNSILGDEVKANSKVSCKQDIQEKELEDA